LIIWDFKAGKPIKTLDGFLADISCVNFSPDGKTIAAGSWTEHIIRLWDRETGEEKTSHSNSIGHTGYIRTVAFNHKGNILASGSGDNTIKIWDTETGQKVRGIVDHTSTVTGICFHPDDTVMVSSEYNKKIHLWDTRTWKLLKSSMQCNSEIMDLAMGPKGDVIASANIDGTVTLWNTPDLESFHSFSKPGNSFALTVAFHPNGHTLASGGEDGLIHIWDVKTKKEKAKLKGHEGIIYDVAFHPDGKVLASACEDGTIMMWDVNTFQTVSTLDDHTGKVYAIDFSHDGKILASGSKDKTLRIWDWKNKDVLGFLEGHLSLVRCLTFHPSENLLASGVWKDKVRMWDVHSFDETFTINERLNHNGALLLSPDGEILMTSRNRSVIQIFNQSFNLQNSFIINAEHPSAVYNYQVLTDGRTMAVIYENSSIAIWDIIKNNCTSAFQIKDMGTIDAIFLSPDGKILSLIGKSEDNVVVSLCDIEREEMINTRTFDNSFFFGPEVLKIASVDANIISIYDSLTGKKLTTLQRSNIEINSSDNSEPFDNDNPEYGEISGLQFSPKGNYIAYSVNNTVCLWDLNSRNLKSNLKINARNICFNHDETLLAALCSNNLLQTWNLSTGKLIDSYQASEYIFRLTFAKTSNVLLAGSYSNLYSWDLAKQKKPQVREMRGWKFKYSLGTNGSIIALKEIPELSFWSLPSREKIATLIGRYFMPDKQFIVSLGLDNTITIFDRHHGKNIATLQDQNQYITAALCNPEKTRIAYGDIEGVITLREFPSGKLIKQVRGESWQSHSDEIDSLFFFPDGKLVSESSDKIIIWDSAIDEVITLFDRKFLYYYRLSPEGNLIALQNKNFTWRLTDIQNRKDLDVLSQLKGEKSYIVFSPDERMIAMKGEDQVLRIVDLNSQKTAVKFKHKDQIRLRKFSPDGSKFVTSTYNAASDNSIIQIHDLHSPDKIISFSIKQIESEVHFSSDTQRLAIISEQSSYSSFIVWDLNTNTALTQHMIPFGYSPEEKMYASVSDGNVHIWDAATWNKIISLKELKGSIEEIEFSHDGKIIVTSTKVSDKISLQLWDISSGQELISLKTDIANVDSLVTNGSTTVWAREYKIYVFAPKRSLPTHLKDRFRFDGLDVEYLLSERNLY